MNIGHQGANSILLNFTFAIKTRFNWCALSDSQAKQLLQFFSFSFQFSYLEICIISRGPAKEK